MRRLAWVQMCALCAVTAVAYLASAGVAFAFNEVTNIDNWEMTETTPIRTTCASCHHPY